MNRSVHLLYGWFLLSLADVQFPQLKCAGIFIQFIWHQLLRKDCSLVLRPTNMLSCHRTFRSDYQLLDQPIISDSRHESQWLTRRIMSCGLRLLESGQFNVKWYLDTKHQNWNLSPVGFKSRKYWVSLKTLTSTCLSEWVTSNSICLDENQLLNANKIIIVSQKYNLSRWTDDLKITCPSAKSTYHRRADIYCNQRRKDEVVIAVT